MNTHLVDAAHDLARQHLLPSVVNHSIRTHLFAELHARRTGVTDFDPELLYVACILHDLGASDAFDGPQRFEIEGADAAADLIRSHGRSDADADQVWQAIALHTSPGIAERRGPVVALTRIGVRIDFASITIPASDRLALETRHPRLRLDVDLAALVAGQALAQPEKGRAPSWTADLVRELHPGTTGPPPWAHPDWL